MESENETTPRKRGLSAHILPASGTLIGVSATLIGLVKIAEEHIGPSRVDEYASIISLIFLVSAISSYLSIRHGGKPISERWELIADQAFLVGLVGITVVSLFFAYEII